MKSWVAALIIAPLVVGCVHERQLKGPVQKTYTHKYGLAVSKDDWNSHGASGKVIEKLRDGVTVTWSYDEGKLHGDSTFSYPNSSLVARSETYDQGRQTKITENFESGLPRTCTLFASNGQKVIEVWYEDGTPRSREVFLGDRLVTAEFYTPSNTIEARITDGNGIRTVRDSLGQLEAEEKFAQGRLVERASLYPNGEPKKIIPFLGNEVHGMVRAFHPGGLPSTVEQYVEGRREGVSSIFANGQKRADVPYRNGIKHGVELRYGPNGEIVEELQWRRGLEHGPHRYIVDGNESTDWYYHGQIVTKGTYDKLNVS